MIEEGSKTLLLLARRKKNIAKIEQNQKNNKKSTLFFCVYEMNTVELFFVTEIQYCLQVVIVSMPPLNHTKLSTCSSFCCFLPMSDLYHFTARNVPHPLNINSEL